MTLSQPQPNHIRECRIRLGLTQAELAQRAGISRTAVTAIEGNQLTPSVQAAMSLARVLETTVEQLFNPLDSSPAAPPWGWPASSANPACWRADVHGRTVCYPATSQPLLSIKPDLASPTDKGAVRLAKQTLVMASCDPAAGLLASEYAAATNLRLLVIYRSSRQAIEMLRQGLVHLAGLHLSTPEAPHENDELVRSSLGTGYELVRLSNWQEGVVVPASTRSQSIDALLKSRLTWIGREPGSGAQKCLEQFWGKRPLPQRIAHSHQGVVEAIRSGWADAGVCIRLVGEEAGLRFLPVREEAFDICFSSRLNGDIRLRQFLKLIRSRGCRKLLGHLPGYDVRETGWLRTVN